MHSDATTPEDYLAGLPEERRPIVEGVRQVILDNLPAGFEETVDFGMLSYVVPLDRYPDTYNGHPLGVVALASQKRYLSLYLMSVYGEGGSEIWFRERWEATGGRLDMGKSCVRFKKLDDVALDVVADVVARTSVDDFIAAYERSRS